MDNPFAPTLMLERRGGVRLVALNRPEHLNAANEEMHAHLVTVWSHLSADPDARVIVLTGTGRGFCAGGDTGLLHRALHDRTLRGHIIAEAGDLMRAMVQCPLPVVAAVNGPAVGLGCNLAVLSDIVYIGESAFLCDPHIPVGLTAADGGAPVWPLLTNLLRAREYLFTGDRIPAAEAVELGLATRVVPDDAVLDTALAFAGRLASLPPQALQSTKRAVNLYLSQAMAGIADYALAAEYQSFDAPECEAALAKLVDG